MQVKRGASRHAAPGGRALGAPGHLARDEHKFTKDRVGVGRMQEATEATEAASAVERAAPPAVGSVPVTVVTGFLGAGKTTLLRDLLAADHGLKIAVIQNELSAAAGLESHTMVGPDGERFERWLELANGCVCCEVRDELAKAIETLLEIKGSFDYVLVVSATAAAQTLHYAPPYHPSCLSLIWWLPIAWTHVTDTGDDGRGRPRAGRGELVARRRARVTAASRRDCLRG